MRLIVAVIVLGMSGSLGWGDFFRLESQSDSPRLIELYTSEGCSSCPPAEEWLGEFLNDPGLWTKMVPVSFHVDYWDRLGWKDKYATRENTLRQYRLRDEGAVKSIYTPGFVVNGKEWRGWFEGKSLGEKESSRGVGKLIVEVNAGNVAATYSGGHDDALLNVAILGVEVESAIARGENRGRLLKHNFVALAHREIPFSNGKVAFALPPFEKAVGSRLGIAAWIVAPGNTQPEVVVGDWLPIEAVRRR